MKDIIKDYLFVAKVIVLLNEIGMIIQIIIGYYNMVANLNLMMLIKLLIMRILLIKTKTNTKTKTKTKI